MHDEIVYAALLQLAIIIDERNGLVVSLLF